MDFRFIEYRFCRNKKVRRHYIARLQLGSSYFVHFSKLADLRGAPTLCIFRGGKAERNILFRFCELKSSRHLSIMVQGAQE